MTKTSGLILYACSGLHISGGTILGTTTACALIKFLYLFWASDLGVELTCGVLVMAGALLCLPLCWICTLVPYNRKCAPLIGAGISFSLASLILLSAGLLSTANLTRSVREPKAINSSMHRAFARDLYDLTTRSAVASMQLDMQCCGVESYKDWFSYRTALPAACCGRVISNPFSAKDLSASTLVIAKDDECRVPLYRSGCLTAAMMHLRAHAKNMAVLTSIVIIVVTITLFTLCYILASESVESSKNRIKAVALHLSPNSSITAPLLFPSGKTTIV